MINLTFGEQVKLVLGRKGMTIKELAGQIQRKTGKKMSRQNLTQRLGRDNFQEQDMRMIAEILDCPFRLSILSESEEVQSEKELLRQNRRNKEPEERDLTMGEFVDMMQSPIPVKKEPTEKEPMEKEAPKKVMPERAIPEEKKEEKVVKEVREQPKREETVKQPEPKKQPVFANRKPKSPDNPVRKFEPIKKRKEEEEDRIKGDVNPYTGHEYHSNSVRMHPKRIGYVQVYDRKEHKWTDMTEWAFLGMEERKKVMLGKDYESPVYLD